MKIDLHFHTTASDGIATPEEMVKIIKKRGLNGFSVTDHDTPGDIDYYQRLAEKYDLVYIAGMEITAVEGHLLVYTLPENAHILFTIKPYQPIQYYQDKTRYRNTILAPAHPFDYFRHGMGRTLFNYFWEAVETFNGSTVFPFANYRASKAAQSLSLPIIGGSDAHTPYYVGFAYTQANADTAKEFFTEIKTRKTTVGGNHLNVIQFSRRIISSKILK
jgi:predicted metal-dependent phosphoesterase TrpH